MTGEVVELAGEALQWKLNDEAMVWREVDGEVVVLQLEQSTYLSVNGSGRELWLRLADGASVRDLADTLCDSYSVAANQALADSEAFLQGLRDNDLVLPVPDP